MFACTVKGLREREIESRSELYNSLCLYGAAEV